MSLPAPHDHLTPLVASLYVWGMFRTWLALGLLLCACTDERAADTTPPVRCEAGARCSFPQDAGADARVDAGRLPCPAERGSTPVILAERFGYPTEVIAPAGSADPVLVTEAAGNDGLRVTVVDAAACETLWSDVVAAAPGKLVAAGRQLVWLGEGGVRVRDLETDAERILRVDRKALDLHLDSDWLYVLTAEVAAGGSGATWLERIARARLSDERSELEPWIRLELAARSPLVGGALTGSSERLIAGFWSEDLDETLGPTLRIDRATGAQAVLAPHETGHGMFALGRRVYAQSAGALLLYEDTPEPVSLRTDLEGRQLLGVISGYAIAAEPSAQLLLALPFDGAAPVQLADEQAAFAGVAASGDDVFWVNWAHRLMTVRGITR